MAHARLADVPTERLTTHVAAAGDDLTLGLVAATAELRCWPVVTSSDAQTYWGA